MLFSHSKLLAVMQEFLLIPAGSAAIWDSVISGVQKLRRLYLNSTAEGEDSDDDDEVHCNAVSLLLHVSLTMKLYSFIGF